MLDYVYPAAYILRMATPTISVVIPSYNEAEYLPKLLECLKVQTFQGFEIVVADNNSDDGTQDIARSYGARVVAGGMPAEGRNRGAAVAKGEFVFFFDADVKIAKGFLKSALKEMRARKAELATCETFPLSNLSLDRFMHTVANFFVKINLENDPHAPGFCILVSKRVYDAVGGFNEKLTLAEDHDFVKRASEHAPLVFLEKVHLLVSVRRYRKEGRLDYMKKVVQVTAHRMLYGEISDDTFEYKFGDFENADESQLRKLERQINKLDKRVMKFRKRNLYPMTHGEEPEFVTKAKKQIHELNEKILKLYEE